MLRAGGALGPWMQACFASLVMYYVERREADVARAIRIKMIEAYNMHFKGVGSADAVLSTWSRELRRQFDRDNLHLATREDKPSHTLQALVAAVTQLSTSVKEGADGVANSLKGINLEASTRDCRGWNILPIRYNSSCSPHTPQTRQ